MPATKPARRPFSHLTRDERPRILGRIEPRRFAEPSRPTLDQRVTAVWSQLVDSGTAECPVCASELRAGSGCRVCGSVLS